MEIRSSFFKLILILALPGSASAADFEAESPLECNGGGLCAQVIACAVGQDGDLRTFPTPCDALCEGYTPVYYTQCKSEKRHCSSTYRPVCATGPDGVRRTYANRCQAINSQARRIRKGACSSDPAYPLPRVPELPYPGIPE